MNAIVPAPGSHDSAQVRDCVSTRSALVRTCARNAQMVVGMLVCACAVVRVCKYVCVGKYLCRGMCYVCVMYVPVLCMCVCKYVCACVYVIC